MLSQINPLLIVAVSVAYTLIGVRIGIVARRKLGPGTEGAVFLPLMLSITWPVFSPVYGIAVFLTGEVGIYGKQI